MSIIFRYILNHPSFVKVQDGYIVNSSKICEAERKAGATYPDPDMLLLRGFCERDNDQIDFERGVIGIKKIKGALKALAEMPNKMRFGRNFVVDLTDVNGLHIEQLTDSDGNPTKAKIHFRLNDGGKRVLPLHKKVDRGQIQFDFLAAQREAAERQYSPAQLSQQTQSPTVTCVIDNKPQ